MPGMEFEYDEKGGTFYYFLLSFMAFILFPATYYLWPRSQNSGVYFFRHFEFEKLDFIFTIFLPLYPQILKLD